MGFIYNQLGRILFALPFGVFGLLHLLNANKMAPIVPSYFPNPVAWVYFVGVCLLLATFSMLSLLKTRLACTCLAIMLMVFVLTIHIPGLSNPQMMMMSMTNLLKDVALAGGALFIASKYN